MQRRGFVYIITNGHHSTLYVGVTSEIYNRIYDHRSKRYPTSFSAQYNLFKLVYFETIPSIVEAIQREKFLKRKSRKYKERLIATTNPDWEDLFQGLDGKY